MKYSVVSVLILFLTWVSTLGQAEPLSKPLTVQQQLTELNNKFTYRGKPVHPRAIQDLVSWVADPLPGPVAIDVEGTYDTNRYFGEFHKRENGVVFIDLEQPILKQKGWFGYRYIGRLANGFHVLQTYDNGGGTGVFGSVLLLECVIDFEYKIDGSRRKFLSLKRRGEFGIGDRYSGEITVKPKENAILIGTDMPINGRSYDNVRVPIEIKIQ